MLPVLAGLAVCEALFAAGVTGLRLRWPNDVLVESRKLAGLLIDQFVPDLAVVGIGINVSNSPAERDPSLRGFVTRLVDLLPSPPTVTELMEAVLHSLTAVWHEAQLCGPEKLLPRVNRLWEGPRRVQLDLDGRLLAGQFEGVDAVGRLNLLLDDGHRRTFEPQEVRLLRDL
jgi:BirA family biotin operon repressor/biotin-[acetyl-CoA-carboxylase] ligase